MPDPIVAESRAMRELLKFVQRVAASEASSFLIEGENGTGKELVATSLHYQSPRKAGPFLAINCAAIPETLLESELFGFEKGAFTDARAQILGLFELADRGTQFLDEIDGIAHSLQAKLLRVLENQSLRRLGGIHPRWTSENRPSVDTSKPANGSEPELEFLYPVGGRAIKCFFKEPLRGGFILTSPGLRMRQRRDATGAPTQRPE